LDRMLPIRAPGGLDRMVAQHAVVSSSPVRPASPRDSLKEI